MSIASWHVTYPHRIYSLLEAFFMMWSKRSDWGIHCDIVNPKLLMLEAAKEILVELYGIPIWR